MTEVDELDRCTARLAAALKALEFAKRNGSNYNVQVAKEAVETAIYSRMKARNTTPE
jgi:hypothetical protein